MIPKILPTLAGAAVIAASTAFPAMAQMTPKEIVQAAMQAIFVDFDAEAATELLAEDYIQHNPSFPTGRDAIVGFIPTLAQPEYDAQMTTHRIFSEGNMVVMHNTFSGVRDGTRRTSVAFDVFRVEDGKVAEHWDNLSPVMPPNPSGRTQTDGATEVTDLELTAQNKALVVDFVDTVLVNRDLSRMAEFFDGDNYIQHNARIGDGPDGLTKALKGLEQQGISFEYGKVHQVIGEGNFVLIMAEGSIGGRPTAFYDLFRVENGKIAEHWDVVSEIPAESANDNGKF